jgi:putative membrane protein
MNRAKVSITATMVATMLAVPVIALGADKSPDADFFKQAAEAGVAEVEAGKLAQDKGSSAAVKDFAAMMVKDHTAANDKLKSLAASENIDLPNHAGPKDMAAKVKLQVLSGDSFDKAYIKNQVGAHRQAVALFRKEAASGQDEQAKAFATATLPTLKSHLKKIDEIAAEAGVTTKSK